jgi:hypothetical protein
MKNTLGRKIEMLVLIAFNYLGAVTSYILAYSCTPDTKWFFIPAGIVLSLGFTFLFIGLSVQFFWENGMAQYLNRHFYSEWYHCSFCGTAVKLHIADHKVGCHIDGCENKGCAHLIKGKGSGKSHYHN